MNYVNISQAEKIFSSFITHTLKNREPQTAAQESRGTAAHTGPGRSPLCSQRFPSCSCPGGHLADGSRAAEESLAPCLAPCRGLTAAPGQPASAPQGPPLPRTERLPGERAPHNAATSETLTKWKYFSVSRSFTVKKRERQWLSWGSKPKPSSADAHHVRRSFAFPKSPELTCPPRAI